MDNDEFSGGVKQLPYPTPRRNTRRRTIPANESSESGQSDMAGMCVALPQPGASNEVDDFSGQNLFSTFLQSPSSEWSNDGNSGPLGDSSEELIFPSTSNKPSVALPLLEMGFSMNHVKKAMDATGR